MRDDAYDSLYAHAMLTWCVAPVDGTTVGVPTGVLHLDGTVSDENFRACYQLWMLWNWDRDEVDVNDDVFVRHWIGLICAGVGWVNIVYDGTKPVACSDCIVFEDALTGKWVFHGDHAYVLPSHRRSGALKMLHKAALDGRDYLGCDRGIAPTTNDGSADFLRTYYLNYEPGWKHETNVLIWDRQRAEKETLCHS